MASITTYAGSLLPPGGTVTGFAVDRAVVLVATATLYVWETSDGHRVSLTGSFTYPSGTTEPPTGTVTEMRWDTNGDGSDDVIVNYGASPLDVGAFVVGAGVNITNNGMRFWNHALTDVNSGTLNGIGFATGTGTSQIGTQGYSAWNLAFGLDGETIEVDTFTITATGMVVGDEVRGGEATYANDSLTFQRSTAGFAAIVGDVAWSSNTILRTLTGGNDTISDSSSSAGETYLVGDVWNLRSNANLTGGADTITGTSYSVTIIGDVWEMVGGFTGITVTGGADILTGSIRDDVIIGDAYEVSSGSAANVLVAGGDTIDGGGGADTIYGDYQLNTTGGVVLQGGDTIEGGTGNDTIWGQTGDDTVDGGSDDDWIEGGVGADDLNGGTNGPDGDTLAYTLSSLAVQIHLGNATATGGDAIGDTIAGFENLIGSAHDDTLEGDINNNVIEGGDGSDTLSRGGGGTDTLRGGEGDDFFLMDQANNGAGANTVLEGGNGTDSILLVGTGAPFRPEEYVFDSVEQIVFAAQTGTALMNRVQFSTAQLEDDAEIASLHIVNQTGNQAQIRVDDGVRTTVDLSGLTFESWVGTNDDVFVLGDADDETFTAASVGSDLRGKGGNDILVGGVGDDDLWGENDDDTIFGSEGADYLNGGLNSAVGDTLSYAMSDSGVVVDIQNNTASGGHAEGDTIIQFENLIGSAHDDVLYGRSTSSFVHGGAGNDTIYGDRGDDTLLGENGNDTFIFDLDARDYVLVDGGADYDTIVLTGFSITLDSKDIRSIEALTFDMVEDSFGRYLSTNAETWKTAAPTGLDVSVKAGAFAGIELDMDLEKVFDMSTWTFTDWSGLIEITGDADAETISAGDEDAIIDGNGGADTINGGAGHDDIDGGSGADTMSGGGGNDEYWLDQTGDMVVELAGEGYDRIYATGITTYVLPDHVERLTFLDSGNHTATGNAGNNRFDGNAGFDTFIFDGMGNDTYSGGLQLDTYDARAGTLGLNINLATGIHTGDAEGDIFASMEIFWGSQTAGDAMTAGAGRAKFYGYGGDDTLTGGTATVDYLDGGIGNDTLSGLAGVDVMRGFTGNDTMTGGTGADQFLYVFAGFDHDTITDYEDGLDYLKVFSAVADEVSDFTITGNGTSSVVLTLNDGTGENTITLNGVGGSIVTIDAGDFLFY